MPEVKKFSADEITRISAIRNELAQVTQQFGQLSFARHVIDRDLTALKNKFDDLIARESALIQELNERYGAGQLNLDTGEFVPTA